MEKGELTKEARGLRESIKQDSSASNVNRLQEVIDQLDSLQESTRKAETQLGLLDDSKANKRNQARGQIIINYLRPAVAIITGQAAEASKEPSRFVSILAEQVKGMFSDQAAGAPVGQQERKEHEEEQDAGQETTEREQERIIENEAANYLYGGREKGLLINIHEGWNQVIQQLENEAQQSRSKVDHDALLQFMGECQTARESGKYSCPAEFFADRLDPHSVLRGRLIECVSATLSEEDRFSIDIKRNADTYTAAADLIEQRLSTYHSTYGIAEDDIRNKIINPLREIAAQSKASGKIPPLTPVLYIANLEATAHAHWTTGEHALEKSPWRQVEDLQTQEAVETSLVEHLKQYAKSTESKPEKEQILLTAKNKNARGLIAKYIKESLLPHCTDASTGNARPGQEIAHNALSEMVNGLTLSPNTSVEKVLMTSCNYVPVDGKKSVFVHRDVDGLKMYQLTDSDVSRYNPMTKRYEMIPPHEWVGGLGTKLIEASSQTRDTKLSGELREAGEELVRVAQELADPTKATETGKTLKELQEASKIPEHGVRAQKMAEIVSAKGNSWVFVAKWLSGAAEWMSRL